MQNFARHNVSVVHSVTQLQVHSMYWLTCNILTDWCVCLCVGQGGRRGCGRGKMKGLGKGGRGWRYTLSCSIKAVERQRSRKLLGFIFLRQGGKTVMHYPSQSSKQTSWIESLSILISGFGKANLITFKVSSTTSSLENISHLFVISPLSLTLPNLILKHFIMF